MWALVIDDRIVQAGVLPQLWWDGDRWWDFRPGQHDPAGTGWQEVEETPRPADTDTTTHESTIELVDGIPTMVWSPREWTTGERTVRAAQSVEAQLVTDTANDLAKLDQAIDELQVLLGDNTVEGSIRQWRASVTNQYSVASMRALADLLIANSRADRRVARQTLRLAKAMAGDYTSADVGPGE